jgi:hypothetical protein
MVLPLTSVGGLHLLFSSRLIQEVGWHMPCNSAQLAALNCCNRVTLVIISVFEGGASGLRASGSASV